MAFSFDLKDRLDLEEDYPDLEEDYPDLEEDYPDLEEEEGWNFVPGAVLAWLVWR
jgi:hypothetical protein